MKLIALPDLHNTVERLELLAERLAGVDLVLLVGDMTNNGTFENISSVVETIRKYNQSIFAVEGNWDGQEVSDYLENQTIGIHRKHKVFDNLSFLGIGGSLISNNTPNEFSEADFLSFLQEASAAFGVHAPFILVSHQPPFNTTTDHTYFNEHVGSASIRAFIERCQPLICFTGHIHEGVGIDTIGDTKIINPGPLWMNHFAYAEISNTKIVCLEIRSL